MDYIVKLLPPAFEDIQEIYNYIAFEKKSKINAESQIQRIKKAISDLSFMQDSYRLFYLEPWKSKGLRYFPVDNFLIFYLVDESKKTVNVARIVYGKADLSIIFK